MTLKEALKGIVYLIIGVIFILTIWAKFYPHTDIQGTTKILIEQNYQPIKVGGHAWFIPGNNWSATKFTDITAKGDKVTGYCVIQLSGKGALYFE